MLHKQKDFFWNGVNQIGVCSTGTISADSFSDAKNKLRKQGVIVRSIIKKRRTLSVIQANIKPRNISELTLQIATTINTGVTFVQTCELIARNNQNPRIIRLIMTIKHDIESGLTIAEALGKHPRIFNSLFCNLVTVGEASGTLDVMFHKIATHLDKIENIKQRINKTLAYPLMVLLIACILTAGLLIYVVPQFEALFRSFKAQLPYATLCVIRASKFVKTHGISLILGLIACVLGFRLTHRYKLWFVRIVDKFLLKVPILSGILQNLIIARVTSALSITYSAGIPLVDALRFVALIAGNLIYTESLQNMSLVVSKGERIQSAMYNTGLFPEFVVHMVGLGEESGTIDVMLNHVARYYEATCDHTILSLSNILEPIIMALLGIIVGGLIIAMYIPILKLGSIL